MAGAEVRRRHSSARQQRYCGLGGQASLPPAAAISHANVLWRRRALSTQSPTSGQEKRDLEDGFVATNLRRIISAYAILQPVIGVGAEAILTQAADFD